MARNPAAQRPRDPRWPRPHEQSISLSILERFLIAKYAEANGLAFGAAVRELALARLLEEADGDLGKLLTRSR